MPVVCLVWSLSLWLFHHRATYFDWCSKANCVIALFNPSLHQSSRKHKRYWQVAYATCQVAYATWLDGGSLRVRMTSRRRAWASGKCHLPSSNWHLPGCRMCARAHKQVANATCQVGYATWLDVGCLAPTWIQLGSFHPSSRFFKISAKATPCARVSQRTLSSGSAQSFLSTCAVSRIDATSRIVFVYRVCSTTNSENRVGAVLITREVPMWTVKGPTVLMSSYLSK